LTNVLAQFPSRQQLPRTVWNIKSVLFYSFLQPVFWFLFQLIKLSSDKLFTLVARGAKKLAEKGAKYDTFGVLDCSYPYPNDIAHGSRSTNIKEE
jgi:hypothetical protein